MKEVILFLSEGNNNPLFNDGEKMKIKSKKLLRIFSGAVIILSGLVILCTQSCKKLEIRRVVKIVSGEPTAVGVNFAAITGTFLDIGEGTIIQYGHCWGTDENISIEKNSPRTNLGSRNSTGNFVSELYDLQPSTIYMVKAYAVTDGSITYGHTISFRTNDISLPAVETAAPAEIGINSAVCEGNVVADGGSPVTERGLCWNTNPEPAITDFHTNNGTGPGVFTGNLTGLKTATKYYVRAYATNSLGTAYGNQFDFKTRWDNSDVTDFDGNSYSTVQIGEQIWMSENLRSIHYTDGESLVDGKAVMEISGDISTKYFFSLFNDEGNIPVYGRLYTWAAVMNGESGNIQYPEVVHGICPVGWHVPGDDEWKELEIFLGMSPDEVNLQEMNRGTNEGGKLKEAGYAHWISPNTGGTNESGFTGLPGGYRDPAGNFIQGDGYFWSSTEFDNTAWARILSCCNPFAGRGLYKKEAGFSVRCLKD